MAGLVDSARALARSALTIGKTPVGLYSKPLGSEADRMLQGIFPGAIGAPPDRTINEFLRSYSKSPWLRAITSKVAHAVAVTPWRAYRVTTKAKRTETGKVIGLKAIHRASDFRTRSRLIKSMVRRGELQEIDESPILDLLHNPNPWLTGLQTFRLVQTYLDLTGEAFLLKQRATPNGPPISLWPVPPTWVINTPTETAQKYRISFRGWQGEIPDTEILWLADANPLNPYGRGTGIANALGDELDTDEFAGKYTRSFFFNNASPSILVWPKGTDSASSGDIKAMKQRWLSEHQGFFKAYRPFFSSREIDVKVISSTLNEMQITQLRSFERDMCLQTFGMPPEIFGVLENSNRATIDAADYLMSKYATDPRLEFLRSILQMRLVPEFKDEGIVLDYDSPIAADNEFALKVMTAYPHGFQVDEFRELAGREALPDGAGEAFFVNGMSLYVRDLSVIETTEEDYAVGGGDPFAEGGDGGDDDAADNPGDDLQPGDDDAEDDSGAEESGKHHRRKSRPGRNPIGKGPRAKSRRRTASAADRVARKLEPTARKRFLSALKKLEGRIDVDAVAEAYSRRNIEAVIQAINWSGFKADLSPALATVYAGFEAAGLTEAGDVGKRLSVDFVFDIKNPRAIRIAKETGGRLVTEITDASKKAIADAVSRALDLELTRDQATALIKNVTGLTKQHANRIEKLRIKLEGDGVSEADIERRLAKLSSALKGKRADMIARTEIQDATNLGQSEAWQQAVDKGLIDATKTKRVWIVTDDDRLDLKICEPMDGQEVGLFEPFRDGEGAQVDNPPAHVGCRCAQGLVFKD